MTGVLGPMKFVVQEFDFSGQSWFQLSQPRRDFHAGVDHRQHDDLEFADVANEIVFTDSIEIEAVRESRFVLENIRILGNQVQRRFEILEIFGGRLLAPLKSGILFNFVQVG